MSSESCSGKSSYLQGVFRGVAVAAERGGLNGSAARGAAYAEVDSVRVQGVEGAEGFGYLERGVMR